MVVIYFVLKASELVLMERGYLERSLLLSFLSVFFLGDFFLLALLVAVIYVS
jgi:hypothetical protein